MDKTVCCLDVHSCTTTIYLSLYLMVTLGMGWKPSSLAGRAGEPVQKYTRSWRSRGDIFSITDHSQRLKVTSLNITRNKAKLKCFCCDFIYFFKYGDWIYIFVYNVDLT